MAVFLIGASPAAGSLTQHLLAHVGLKLGERGLASNRLDLRDLPAQALLRAERLQPDIARALRQFDEADAIVLATPVCHAAYSALAKAFLDLLAPDAMAGKLVLPLACNDVPSNVLELDFALRPVFAALGATHVLTSVHASVGQIAWHDDTGLRLAHSISARVNYAVNEIAASLRVRALQAARAAAGVRSGAGA